MQHKAKILFVDDEERIVKLLNMMFRSKYHVFTATSGADALNIIRENKINVIVSDQRMPEMTGIQLLSEVCKLSPNTVRLLLTGYSDLVAIIGAVNEGEVYRFLNKPWNQDEIKTVIAESVEIALASEEHAQESSSESELPHHSPEYTPLASAAKLLALDGVANDRYDIVEMFTKDYHVLTASTITDVLSILEDHEIGVIIADTHVHGEDTTELLRTLKNINPFITIVMLTSVADSDMVIKLINQAHIYRFAMKPISPNVFRLAVAAAMREHHRLLADPRLSSLRNKSVVSEGMPEVEGSPMVKSIIKSLSRFTKIW